MTYTQEKWDGDSRPDFDTWGLLVASAVGTRGECQRRKVGAVILDEHHRIIGAGYNGAPPGQPSCLDGMCPRAFTDVPPGSTYDEGPGRCLAVHAEVNAIIDCGRERLMGGTATMYVTERPCFGCQKILDGYRLRVVHL